MHIHCIDAAQILLDYMYPPCAIFLMAFVVSLNCWSFLPQHYTRKRPEIVIQQPQTLL